MAKDSGDMVDKHFHREDQEKIAKLREKADAEKAAAAAQALKDLHHLHCGKCGNKMDTTMFRGVEIEICPACGSVLLDPGELEQLAGKDKSGGVNFFSELFSFSKGKE